MRRLFLVMAMALIGLPLTAVQSDAAMDAVTKIQLSPGWNNVGLALTPTPGQSARDFYDQMLGSGLDVPYFAIYDGVDWQLYTPTFGNAPISLESGSSIWAYALDQGSFTYAGQIEFSQGRAIHLSPDAPSVDVGLDRQVLALPGLDFGSGSGYARVTADTYDIGLNAAGSGVMSPLLEVPFTFADGLNYTFAAYDFAANLSVLPLEDDLSDPGQGNIRVRAVHTASGVGQVDILNAADSSELFADLDFGAASAAAELPEGTYSLGIDANDDGASDFTFDLPFLPAGTIANVFAVRDGFGMVSLIAQFADGTTAQIPSNNMPANASVRGIHLSYNAPEVDILATDSGVGNTTSIATNFGFGDASMFMDVPENTYDLDVVPTGGSVGDSVLNVPNISFAADTTYSVVATGDVTGPDGLLLVEDLTAPAAGNTRLRGIHAAQGVGQVDVWDVTDPNNPSPLYPDFDYLSVGAYAEVPAGPIALGVDTDDDAQPNFVFDLTTADGRIYNLFVALDSAGTPVLVSVDQDGNTATVFPSAPAAAFARVLHLSPDAPPVDAYANRMPTLFNGIGYLDEFAFETIPEGTYTFEVLASGTTDFNNAVLTIPNRTLNAGEFYTFVAYDELANIKEIALVDDLNLMDANLTRLRVVHAASLGQVDIWDLTDPSNPTPFLTDVDQGAVGPYVDMAPMAMVLGIDIDDDATPDFVFDVPALDANSVYNIYAVVDQNGPFLLAQDFRGDLTRIDPRAPVTEANVRAIHLSPNAPAVDIFANGSATSLTGLGFESSSDYLAVPEGTYTFDVVPESGSIGDSVLNVANQSLMGGEFYIVVAFDELPGIQALLLNDDQTAPAAGNFRVRLVHTAVGVGQVDVWNITDPANPTQVQPDFDFGAATGFLELPSQAYVFGLDLDNDAVADVVFDIPALPTGTIGNLYAVTDAGGPFLLLQGDGDVTIRIDPREEADIRALHLSPGAPAVDIEVQGLSPRLGPLDFGGGSDYLTVPAGTYDLTLFEAGTNADISTVSGVDLNNDVSYSAIAFDDPGNLQVVLLEDDTTTPAAGTFRIRVGHLAVGIGRVDIYEVSDPGRPQELFLGVDFGDVEDAVELPSDAYELGFDLDGDQVVDVTFSVPQIDAGEIVNAFAATDRSGDPSIYAHFSDGTVLDIPAN